jgi:hypothetical protein
MLERISTPNLRVPFSDLDALTPWERRDARNARYFAPGVSLRVRRVALDDIPSATGKNSEGGSWSTQPT